MKYLLQAVIVFCSCIVLSGGAVPLADPYILLHEDTYYAYGTRSKNGIVVFSSKDLKNWKYERLALNKKDVWGTRWFWAPEVYKTKDGFLMYYSADEHLCAARSDSPLGPFTQVRKEPLLPGEKAIDHTLFVDSDGQAYIFFSRIKKGNVIWCAELEKDWITIRKETLTRCIEPMQPWELHQGRVNEGAAVLKHGGKYFLTYSGNKYTSHEYGIGCAVADSPRGPWVKDLRNPLFQKVKDLVGVGHHSFFRDKAGALRVVFHAHRSKEKVYPRVMYITTAHFENGELVISPDYMVPDRKVRPRKK